MFIVNLASEKNPVRFGFIKGKKRVMTYRAMRGIFHVIHMWCFKTSKFERKNLPYKTGLIEIMAFFF